MSGSLHRTSTLDSASQLDVDNFDWRQHLQVRVDIPQRTITPEVERLETP
ncbi:hypothetical protein HUG17_5779 [Dermatophagoides farinae]|uniref:Uncharacterized protein n=1 Tax=Dermatophagoides farinae TaxID=6954 RepID=A0A9D4P339_DERFA|nr:hypothetical protein HUG17_5779 [Dermatophagoides farinae]